MVLHRRPGHGRRAREGIGSKVRLFGRGLRQNFTIGPSSLHTPTRPSPFSSARVVPMSSPSMVSTNGPIHRPSRSHSTATARTFHAAVPRAPAFTSSSRDDNDRHAAPLSENNQQQRGGFWLHCIAHTIVQDISELQACKWALLRVLQWHMTLVPSMGTNLPTLMKILAVCMACAADLMQVLGDALMSYQCILWML